MNVGFTPVIWKSGSFWPMPSLGGLPERGLITRFGDCGPLREGGRTR